MGVAKLQGAKRRAEEVQYSHLNGAAGSVAMSLGGAIFALLVAVAFSSLTPLLTYSLVCRRRGRIQTMVKAYVPMSQRDGSGEGEDV